MSESFRSRVLDVDTCSGDAASGDSDAVVDPDAVVAFWPFGNPDDKDPLDPAAERLARRVDRELDRVDGLLFTATPRQDLLEVARFSRLQDASWVAMVRQIVRLTNAMSMTERDFAGDEVALALGVSPVSGRVTVWQAGSLAALPGLLEAVEVGKLGRGHVLACLAVLDESSLTLEQRQAVVVIALARYVSQTPGEWARLVKRLVITVNRQAYEKRKDEETALRRTVFYPLPGEQGGMTLQAPLEQVAAVEARLDAEAKRLKQGGDERTMDQLRTDLALQLLTSGLIDGQPAAPWSVAVVVPLSVLEGEDTEVAEIPGWGPILPSTARDLAAQAQAFTSLGVDTTDGHVLGVSTPEPVPAENLDVDVDGRVSAHRSVHDGGEPCLLDLVAAARRAARFLDEAVAATTWTGYAASPRLKRYLQARDRTCTFPGCGKPAEQTDKDHLDPWPAGVTAARNMHCLCRHHHRAKQAVFRVVRHQDGSTTWTTRGAWDFTRPPKGY